MHHGRTRTEFVWANDEPQDAWYGSEVRLKSFRHLDDPPDLRLIAVRLDKYTTRRPTGAQRGELNGS